MRKGDLVVGGGEAYRIVDIEEGAVKVRLVAGRGLDVCLSEVPRSFMDGRTLYRPTSEMDDVDGRLAVAEVSRHVDVAALGHNPRLWVEAFLSRYRAGEPVPDSTTLLGWFSRMISAGSERRDAELEDARAEASRARRGRPRAAVKGDLAEHGRKTRRRTNPKAK